MSRASTAALLAGLAFLAPFGCDSRPVSSAPPELYDRRAPSYFPPERADLVFVVDDSPAIGQKLEAFANTAHDIVLQLAVGAGHLPITDIHVAVVDGALGRYGGELCKDDRSRTNSERVTLFDGAAMPNLAVLANAVRDSLTGFKPSACPFGAPLEAAYRFLVQPDPPMPGFIVDAQGKADIGDEVDIELLARRADFLRPDSIVLVTMLTDRDDASLDPRSVGGLGWRFLLPDPLPRPPEICRVNPLQWNCVTCLLGPKAHRECQTAGLYTASEDPPAVRFANPSERFGVDPRFPIQRYTDGFTKMRVPDRHTEHRIRIGDAGVPEISGYSPTPTCTNPLFAESLPRRPQDERCNLRSRGRAHVHFAVVGGVAPALLPPADAMVTEAMWHNVLGRHPMAFDFTGIDPHMIPWIAPRPGLPLPSETRGDNGSDPIHGREWDTGGADLQYACTFPIPAHGCTSADLGCDCASERNPPLCSAVPGVQTRGKAYPSQRPLALARSLLEDATIDSACATTRIVDALHRRIIRLLEVPEEPSE